jgi:hypothetical protein
MTAGNDDRERFRHLPAPISPEDAVESVDTTTRPLPDPDQERDRLLREAGG